MVRAEPDRLVLRGVCVPDRIFDRAAVATQTAA